MSRSRSHTRGIVAALILTSVLVISAAMVDVCPAQDESASTAPPPIEKIGDNLYRIGKLTIDGDARELTMPGWVNMSEGLVELLACAPGGKTHESVLVIDVEPYHLQVALLALGLEARGNLEFQGDPRTPDGDPVEIHVEWKDPENGKVTKRRGEELVYNVKADRPMKKTHWVFTGSRVVDGAFIAQLDGSLVTTYHDPNTIIDNPLPTGGDDTFYEANRFLVPPVGTKVTMKIRALEPGGVQNENKKEN